MDKIIGRKTEKKQVLECFESDKSELVSVYGRRRVGKTFLIKQCFNEEFDFWFTGIYKATRVQHLTQFQNALQEKSDTKIKTRLRNCATIRLEGYNTPLNAITNISNKYRLHGLTNRLTISKYVISFFGVT